LTSVIIPSSVTSIGDWAFFETKLTSVTLPAKVKAEENAFPGNLGTVYNDGKQAGTYRSSDSGKTWARQ
jgi:hypothetical protein